MTDFDKLLEIRATLSCLYGFVEAKKQNIKKNVDEIEKGKRLIPQLSEYRDYSKRIVYLKQSKENYSKEYMKAYSEYSKAHFWNKRKKEKAWLDAQRRYYAICGEVHRMELALKNYQAKFGDVKDYSYDQKVTKMLADLENAVKADYDAIQKAFNDFDNREFAVHKSDLPYLDYLIYLFDTHRATSIKEALQLLDEHKRHNELLNAINQLRNEITQSINGLTNVIIGATQSINANLNAINMNLTQVNYNLDSLNSKASKVISNQLDTKELIKAGNQVSALSYQELKKQTSSLQVIDNRIAFR